MTKPPKMQILEMPMTPCAIWTAGTSTVLAFRWNLPIAARDAVSPVAGRATGPGIAVKVREAEGRSGAAEGPEGPGAATPAARLVTLPGNADAAIATTRTAGAVGVGAATAVAARPRPAPGRGPIPGRGPAPGTGAGTAVPGVPSLPPNASRAYWASLLDELTLLF